MRTSCLDCARKHLGQASVLMDEAMLGYPTHKWLAIGHMAEAESELVCLYIVEALDLRELRKAYEQGAPVDILLMIDRLTSLHENLPSEEV